MDILDWFAHKILTECGLIDAIGWILVLIIAPQLAVLRRRIEKRDREILEDLMEQRERAQRRLDDIGRLERELAEIKGRLYGHSDDS